MTSEKPRLSDDRQSACCSDELFLALLGGCCAEKEKDAIRLHLQSCSSCHERFMAIAFQQLTTARADTSSSPGRSRSGCLLPVLIVAAGIIINIFIFRIL